MARRNPRAAAALPNPAVDNLSKVDHIVVLMLENRSFDHMLGYLSLTGGRNDVDGLRPGMSNDHDGGRIAIRRLTNTAVSPDPCHTAACVAQQISNNNNGFADSYASAGGNPDDIMGYYDAASVPVYDLLAREYVVCDKWFSPVPGATWPNRLYSLTGQAPKKDNQKVPLYYIPSFVRHLDASSVSWRWYAHEKILLGPVGTIDLADGAYETAKNVVFFDPHFFADARNGNLPAVSWIDPNFTDFGGLKGANDDHPPVDITAGQGLVQSVVQALSNSPLWSKTLLIITYDEHGGFYDHVAPGPAPDDRAAFRQYGVRVPAIVVSPWVGQGVANSTIFDHTSIIKTILLRFCRDAAGRIPSMGVRVDNANHLGPLVANASARAPLPASAFQPITAHVRSWISNAHVERMAIAASAVAPKSNDFQEGWKLAVAELEKRRLRQLAAGGARMATAKSGEAVRRKTARPKRKRRKGKG